MEVKEISVSSKRTAPVGKDYFSFSCAITASVSKEDDPDIAFGKIWDIANAEVDNRFIEVRDSLTKK